MKAIKKSRRQVLAEFVGSGNLRYKLEGTMRADALELLIDIAARYCQPKRKRTQTGSAG